MGPTLGGGVEPDRADRAWPNPRPAQRVIFSNHGPKPDQVCEIPIPRDVGPARPASFQSHCPAWLVRSSEYFRSSCCVSSSRFRGSNVLVSPRPALPWGVACSLQSAYEAESAMPLYRPSDTVGAVWVTWCLDQAHIEPRQMSPIVILFFLGKS